MLANCGICLLSWVRHWELALVVGAAIVADGPLLFLTSVERPDALMG
jgi:hypothetical protein